MGLEGWEISLVTVTSNYLLDFIFQDPYAFLLSKPRVLVSF